MNRRRLIRMIPPTLAALLVLAFWIGIRTDSSVARSEGAMRTAFKTGWAGTNEAHRIVQRLPTQEALRVLVELLRAPEPRAVALYRGLRSRLPAGLQKSLASPPSPGPVELCAYRWLAEALTRTNVAVDPLLPLLEEKPDLFWNILPEPLLLHLRAHQEDVRKLVPLLRDRDFKVVNVVSYLVANSDADGISEPEFRRLLTSVPLEWVEQMANGLLLVSRRPEATADWLWAELGREKPERTQFLAATVQQLEVRIRREAGFLRVKLDSTNRPVRLAALRLAAAHPFKAAQVFGRVAALAASPDAEARALALRASGLVAGSPQCSVALRAEAARVVLESGDRELIEAMRRPGLPNAVKAALAGAGGSTHGP